MLWCWPILFFAIWFRFYVYAKKSYTKNGYKFIRKHSIYLSILLVLELLITLVLSHYYEVKSSSVMFELRIADFILIFINLLVLGKYIEMDYRL